MSENIDELKKQLKMEKLAKDIFMILNNFIDLNSCLKTVVKHLKRFTGCEAVGIRLHEKGDYPYFVTEGFAEQFLQKESLLCKRDAENNRIYSHDDEGYMLECICGKVIRGNLEKGLQCYTDGGSFWTTSSSFLLETQLKEGIVYGDRNYCNFWGYETLALIPLKFEDKRQGLIQFNDTRKGVFSKELIEYLEGIALQIGIAIQNYLQYKELLQRLSKLEETSITDPLTGIYNRRYLYHRFDESLDRYRRNKKNCLAVVVIDLDKFKQTNDKYGHAMGDELLKEFAGILENNIRSYDIACRYGGDEFVLLLDDATSTQAMELMKRIESDCKRRPVFLEQNEVNILFSYGIADTSEFKNTNNLSAEKLLKIADEKLLKSKKSEISGDLRRKGHVNMW